MLLNHPPGWCLAGSNFFLVKKIEFQNTLMYNTNITLITRLSSLFNLCFFPRYLDFLYYLDYQCLPASEWSLLMHITWFYLFSSSVTNITLITLILLTWWALWVWWAPWLNLCKRCLLVVLHYQYYLYYMYRMRFFCPKSWLPYYRHYQITFYPKTLILCPRTCHTYKFCLWC